MDDHQGIPSKRRRSEFSSETLNRKPTADQDSKADSKANPKTEPHTISSTEAISSNTNAQTPETPKTKEALYAEAKARRIAAITTRNELLTTQIASLRSEIEVQKALLRDPDATATVRTHIKLLHQYNEMRDVGQGLIGMVADNRGLRISELYESGEFGVGVKD